MENCGDRSLMKNIYEGVNMLINEKLIDLLKIIKSYVNRNQLKD